MSGLLVVETQSQVLTAHTISSSFSNRTSQKLPAVGKERKSDRKLEVVLEEMLDDAKDKKRKDGIVHVISLGLTFHLSTFGTGG